MCLAGWLFPGAQRPLLVYHSIYCAFTAASCSPLFVHRLCTAPLREFVCCVCPQRLCCCLWPPWRYEPRYTRRSLPASSLPVADYLHPSLSSKSPCRIRRADPTAMPVCASNPAQAPERPFLSCDSCSPARRRSSAPGQVPAHARCDRQQLHTQASRSPCAGLALVLQLDAKHDQPRRCVSPNSLRTPANRPAISRPCPITDPAPLQPPPFPARRQSLLPYSSSS